MGKYEPLADYLRDVPNESWNARFSDVEKILGFPLPQSAHRYPAWWANQDAGHSQTRGWQDAGWETSDVDLAGKRLRFVRRRGDKGRSNAAGSREADKSLEDLMNRARAISGINDRDEIMKASLSAFIQREAAKRLIALGGSDPNFKPAPRERPFG